MAYRDAGQGALARVVALEREVERLKSAAVEQVAAEQLKAYQREFELMERRLGEQAERYNAQLVAMDTDMQKLHRHFREDLEIREARWREAYEHLRIEARAASAQADVQRRELASANGWLSAARKAGGRPPSSYHESCIANLQRELDRARTKEQQAEARRREVGSAPLDLEAARTEAERISLQASHAVARKSAELDHDVARMARAQIESQIQKHTRELDERAASE